MRFFIRNKTKYDPSVAFKDPVITVNVDHTQEITKIKEEARKVGKGCKITALYVGRQDGSFVDLADDRTINYYNLQDGTILETTSNPFWVTTLYSNMRRREQEAASNPEDARLCFQAQKSYIHRCMAIGLLLNGTGETEKQPATFHALEDLYEYCLNQGKKPAYMSQFTLEELQEMFETFQEEHQNHRDPIGSFIYSQSVKLGYLQENNTIDGSDPFRSYFEQSEGQQRDVHVPARRNGGQNRNGAGGGRRRRANRIRICDDCEATMAISYCADCNPPLCLCDTCWRSLHRGATRRNHQMKDILEAPTPTTYTPQAYRVPFAMLVAFHRALQEQPQKLSLTAEDIKIRAQPFTDTDLEEAKQRGKPFSGFDSLENALMKHDIVLKEAAETPKYSLLESGKELALKCSNFDYAVQTLLRQADVPTVPVPAVRPAVFDNRQVCLLVDTEEPQKDRFVKVARERGLSARVRKLPSADFCWILLPPGAPPRDVPEQELVLPYLVERKTWDDLWSSVRSPRFENQVQRMKACGIQNLFYLVEGSPKDISGRPGPEVEAFLQGKLDRLLLEDKFFVNRTPSWLKTVEWLCHLTNLAIECQQAGDRKHWMTFAEFTRIANKAPVANINRNAQPAAASGIVWSASDFANNIKSHHQQQRDIGSNLDDVQQLSDSLLVIQGLTAYNTNCNSHLKKALADYLQLPGQTAEECVQIHLEDYTEQLVSVNVFQYYVLYLEVFKRIRIYRTETNEETQDFLSRFGAHAVVKGDQGTGYDTNRPNVQPIKQAADRVDDILFANDSQEEEFMLNQALQQSLADDNAPNNYDDDDHFGHDNGWDDVDNGMSDTGGGGGGGRGGDRGNGTHQTNKQPLSNQEQKPTIQPDTNIYANADQNNNKRKPRGPAQKYLSTSTITVKQEIKEQENNLEDILQFKFYDSLKSCCSEEEKEDAHVKSKQDSEDNELHKIMEESRLQYEKEEKERKALLRSVYNEEEELRKALELSKKEMKQNKMNGIEEMGNPEDRILASISSKNSTIPHRNDSDGNDKEDDLEKVIELSKKDVPTNRMNGKEMGNLFGTCSESYLRKDASISRWEKNGFRNHDDDDDELNRVIELSKRDAEHSRLEIHNEILDVQQGNNLSDQNNFVSEDIQLKKVMEPNKKEFQQKVQEISKTDHPTIIDSQDDKHEDCFYDLEVPEFVNSETHDSGEECPSKKDESSTSSLSDFSDQNGEGIRKDNSIDFKSSSTYSSSSSNKKKCSASTVDDLEKSYSDGEAVLVESQDMKDDVDDDDDIGRKFKERFGNVASSSKGDENNSHYLKNDGDDDIIECDDDDDIGRKFKERFGNVTRSSKGDKNNSHYLKDDDDDDIIEYDDDDDIGRKFKERFGNVTHSSKGDKKNIHYLKDDDDDDDDDDDIGRKFKERFGNVTRSSKGDKNNIHYLKDDDDDDDDDIGRKFKERFGNAASSSKVDKNDDTHDNATLTTDDAILVDSQDMDEDSTVAQNLQERFDKERNQDNIHSNSNSSLTHFDDAILLDSQDENTDEHIAQKLQEQFDKEAGSSKGSLHKNQSSCFADDAILVDSQDDVEVDSTSDYEIAFQLQKQLNQPGNVSGRPSSSTFSSTSSNSYRSDTREQISSYREEQQKRYKEAKTGKTPKNMSPGLAFRQKAEAIAAGKESLLAVVQHGDNDSSTKRRKPEKRGHDGTIKSRIEDSQAGRRTARKSFPTTKNSNTVTTTDNTVNTSDTASCLVFPGSSPSPRPQERHWKSSQQDTTSSSSSSSFVFPGSSPSPRPQERHAQWNSSERNNSCSSSSSSSFVFPGSSPSPRPQEKHWRSTSGDQPTSSLSSTSSFVFPGSFSSSPGCDKQSTSKSSGGGSFSFPGSSRESSSSYQNNASSGFVFPSGSSEFSDTPSPRPSRDTFTSSSQSGFKSDDGLKGSPIKEPKCSECGEIGHRKGMKRCPYYYTEEAQRKREEQARKRREKREEEDRQMQTSIDALTAEQLQRAEQAEQLRRQLEQLTEQNDNLPKVVEDAMKYLKKRRKK